jgi:hypothetical protein
MKLGGGAVAMERNHWSATRRRARRSPKRGRGISGFQAACDGLPGFAALDSSLICSSIKGGDKKTATEAGVQRQFWYCFQETMIKQFRTDIDSPLRQAQIGVYTPVLNHDGSDLAAALETILEIGDGNALRQTVAEAFGGASLLIEATDTLFSMRLQIPGLLRPLQAREFSDG